MKNIVLLLCPPWFSKSWNLWLCHFLVTNIYSDNLQFGYKSKTSTTQCTWLALQTISFFKQKHKSVNVAALDCSKAFDKCLFSKLFGKILARGVPAIFVRGLLAAYELQKACVKWSVTQTASYSFGILNGTRQGSCLSPILFTVYMDGLLVKLRESGFGCYIGDPVYPQSYLQCTWTGCL